MRHFVPALAAAAAIAFAAASPPASATTAVGVSLGAAQLDPSQPTRFDSYHTTSNVRFRWDAFSPYTEMMFGLANRAQALNGPKTYVFETSGLSLSGGLHFGFLRAGVGLEAAWLRYITTDPAAAGTLRFHNGGGFVVEPYVGVVLPFLKSEVTELEISAHYPVLRPDPAIGPRLLLTLWLGGEGDGEDEEEAEEEMEEETPSPEPTAEPTPAPTPKPTAKPSAKPTKPTRPTRRR